MSTFDFDNEPKARPVKINLAQLRKAAIFAGTITQIRTLEIGLSIALQCTLQDDTGNLRLLFTGRMEIPGIAIGTKCMIEGTPGLFQEKVTVINPLYQITDEPPTL